MKKHGKILVLCMFLFIYFVMPETVLADTIKTTSCSCSGGGASTSLTFTKGRKPTIGDVDWGGKVGEVINSPDSNKDYYSDLNDGECPIVVIKKMTYTGASDNLDGTLTNKTRAQVYYYSPRRAADADAWSIAGCENQNQIFAAGSRNSMCKEIVSAKLNCTASKVEDHEDTSSANNTNDSEVNNASSSNNDDTEKSSRERKKKKVSPYKQRQSTQSCEEVFGDTGTRESVAWILQKLFNYIRIFGIFLVVVLSALDYSKVVLSNDYEMMKKNQTRFIYRVGAVVALLLLPTLINFLLGLFISGTVTDFSCGIY